MLNTTKQKAWKFYSKWRKNGSYSPALKAHVYVTRRGWNHIYGGNKLRPKKPSEVSSRLKLFPAAKSIIENHTKIAITRSEGNARFHALEKQRVRVIILEKNKVFTFLSVFKVNKK